MYMTSLVSDLLWSHAHMAENGWWLNFLCVQWMQIDKNAIIFLVFYLLLKLLGSLLTQHIREFWKRDQAPFLIFQAEPGNKANTMPHWWERGLLPGIKPRAPGLSCHWTMTTTLTKPSINIATKNKKVSDCTKSLPEHQGNHKMCVHVLLNLYHEVTIIYPADTLD